ncbi:MAG: hypothetical protein ACHQCF_02930 [Solirubrobacterales bacterium]
MTHRGYINGEGTGIRTMSVGAGGSLAIGPVFASGGASYSAAAISPDGGRLYAASYTNSFLAAFTVNPDGLLTFNGASNPYSVRRPQGVSIVPSGRTRTASPGR